LKRLNITGGAAALLTLCGCQTGVLHPQGPVGVQESRLIAETFLVMLIVVVPVIVMTLGFAWRYRASNTKAAYAPDFVFSRKLELAVWGVPALIVIALTVLNWRSTLALNPYRALQIPGRIITVDVVALNWKWLFIYPDQHIAAVNELVIPAGTQIRFNITSGAAMNVFFIPQLGTQIYAMSGMRTQVYLMAKNPGTYRGLSANFSGAGFPDMRFATRAVSNADFARWVRQTQAAPLTLTGAMYQNLTGATIANPVMLFGNVQPGLFAQILDNANGIGTMLPSQRTE
jgi:cytochrome o ubiquinol oxidase subunit 2